MGSHTTESCPLNNAESRKVVLGAPSDLLPFAKKYKISSILGQYHSPLEHTFLWVVEAEDPHLVQQNGAYLSCLQLQIEPLYRG